MREILFKAKRKDNGKWEAGYYEKKIEWFQIGYRYLQTEKHYICVNMVRSEDSYIDRIEVVPDTICQYTGLKDKKGNMIWENDVVYARCNGLSGYGVVKYEKGCFVLKDSKRDRIYSLFGEWTFRVDGNIFDNPELLGV